MTVTASPARGPEATLATSERLAGYGYRAVPYLSARLVVDGANIKDILQRLAAAHIDDVLVVDGDADVPAGADASALDLLTAMARARSRLRPGWRDRLPGAPRLHPPTM